MSDATTPANPTGQIATVAAVLSPEPPIVPTSGTKCVPDDSEVVQNAQLVERLRKDATACAGRDECQVPLMYCAFGPADHCAEYAALWLRILAERDALMAEHEAAKRLEHWHPEGCRFCAAHDNAERVIHGE